MDLQCCINFCCTAKWFSYTYIYILFHILFCCDWSQDGDYSSLWATVPPCRSSILYESLHLLIPHSQSIPPQPHPTGNHKCILSIHTIFLIHRNYIGYCHGMAVGLQIIFFLLHLPNIVMLISRWSKKIFFNLSKLLGEPVGPSSSHRHSLDGKWFLPRMDSATHFPSQQTSLVAQTVKRLPTMQETRVQSLGQEDLLEKEMAPHSSILAWKIPWMEKPGRLQSMGSQRVGHKWVTSLSLSFKLWKWNH